MAIRNAINFICILLITALAPAGCNLEYQICPQRTCSIFSNSAAGIYTVVDHTNEWITFHNGNRGSCYCVDSDTSTTWYVPHGVFSKNTEDFGNYINRTDLESTKKQCAKEGFMYYPETAPIGINKELTYDLSFLDKGLYKQCETIATTVRLSSLYGKMLKNNLKGLEEMIAEEIIKIKIGLLGFMAFLQGFDKLAGCYEGGLTFLRSNNFNLDLRNCLPSDETTGFTILIKILTQLVISNQKLDVLQLVLNDDKNFFKVVGLLSGGKIGAGQVGSGDKVSIENVIPGMANVGKIAGGKAVLEEFVPVRVGTDNVVVKEKVDTDNVDVEEVVIKKIVPGKVGVVEEFVPGEISGEYVDVEEKVDADNVDVEKAVTEEFVTEKVGVVEEFVPAEIGGDNVDVEEKVDADNVDVEEVVTEKVGVAEEFVLGKIGGDNVDVEEKVDADNVDVEEAVTEEFVPGKVGVVEEFVPGEVSGDNVDVEEKVDADNVDIEEVHTDDVVIEEHVDNVVIEEFVPGKVASNDVVIKDFVPGRVVATNYGGGKCTDVNSLTVLISHIMCYLDGEMSQATLVPYLRQYITTPGVITENVQEKLIYGFTQLKTFMVEYKLQENFSVLYQKIQDILEMKYVYKGVKIMGIIKLLLVTKLEKMQEEFVTEYIMKILTELNSGIDVKVTEIVNEAVTVPTFVSVPALPISLPIPDKECCVESL